jgi:hypothetical protein
MPHRLDPIDPTGAENEQLLERMEPSQIAPEAESGVRDDRHVAQFAEQMKVSQQFVLFAAHFLAGVRRSIDMRDLARHVDETGTVTPLSVVVNLLVVGRHEDLRVGVRRVRVDEREYRLADVPSAGK